MVYTTCVTHFSGFLEGFFQVPPSLLYSYPGPSCASALDSICPSAGDESVSLAKWRTQVWLPKVIVTPALSAQAEPSLWPAEGTDSPGDGEGGRREAARPPLPPRLRHHRHFARKARADALRSPHPSGAPNLRVLSPLLPAPQSLAQLRTRPAAARGLAGWNLPSRALRHTPGRRPEGRRRRLNRRGRPAVLRAPRRGGEQPRPLQPTALPPEPPLPPFLSS